VELSASRRTADVQRSAATGWRHRSPGQAIKVHKLNRKWAQVRLPKVGWVRFRLSRPLGGVVRNGYQAHADHNATRNIERIAAGQAVNSTRSHPQVARPAASRMREPLGDRVG
jgi:hypothetical protein